MNGGGSSSSDTIMKDVTEGYDSTSDDDFEIILPPNPPYISCAKCRRLFQYHAAFLNHVEGCFAREKLIKEVQINKAKGPYHLQFNPLVQRGEAGPSAVPRVLNLFNDPLELRLAPPGPLPPPPSLNLELTLAIDRNKPTQPRVGLFRRQPRNHNKGVGPGGGNAGKNFKM